MIPIVPELCGEWAHIKSECRWKGKPIGSGDCWIAACARFYHIPLVTHNRKDFEMVEGLEVISES